MKVYTIEKYHQVSCAKIHNGKPCGQPIRCSRTIREITTDRQRAIDATKDKPNWVYQEFDVQ